MMCSAKDIAQYIVNWFLSKNAVITNLALQKLLYFAWIDFYKETGEQLFDLLATPFLAWQLGPIVLDVYYSFRCYGGNPILRERPVDISQAVGRIVDKTIDKLKDYSAYELVEKSHRKGGAWDAVYKDGDGRGNEIDFDTIVRLECA